MSDTIFSKKDERFKKFYNNISNEKIKSILKQETEKIENSDPRNNSINKKTQNQKDNNIFLTGIYLHSNKTSLNFYNNSEEQNNDYITTSQNNTISPNNKFKPKINNLTHKKYFPKNLSDLNDNTNTSKMQTMFNLNLLKNSTLYPLHSDYTKNKMNNAKKISERPSICSLTFLKNNKKKLVKTNKFKKTYIEFKPIMQTNNNFLKTNKTIDFCENVDKKNINQGYYDHKLNIKFPFLYEPTIILKKTYGNKSERKRNESILTEFNQLKNYLLKNKGKQIPLIKDTLNKFKINAEKYNTKKLLFLCDFICQFNNIYENKLKQFSSIKEICLYILENTEICNNYLIISNNTTKTKKILNLKNKMNVIVPSSFSLQNNNPSSINGINLSINPKKIRNKQINKSKTKTNIELIKTDFNKVNILKEKKSFYFTKKKIKKNYKLVIKEIGTKINKFNNINNDNTKNNETGTILKISNKSEDNEKLSIKESSPKKYIDSYFNKLQKKFRGRNYNFYSCDFFKKNILYKDKNIKSEEKIEKSSNCSVNKILKSFHSNSLMKNIGLYYVNNN